MGKSRKNGKKYINQSSTRDKFEAIVTEKKFKAKRFAKAELALLYNWHPDTLRRKLHDNKELLDELVFAS